MDVPLEFIQEKKHGVNVPVDIDIRFERKFHECSNNPFDGRGGTLAHAYYPEGTFTIYIGNIMGQKTPSNFNFGKVEINLNLAISLNKMLFFAFLDMSTTKLVCYFNTKNNGQIYLHYLDK